ncbi:hypothetical protein M8C21_024735, partial [Ambrosia artemisiifolia]
VIQSRRWSRGLRLRSELRGIDKQVSFWNSTNHPYLQQKKSIWVHHFTKTTIQDVSDSLYFVVNIAGKT